MTYARLALVALLAAASASARADDLYRHDNWAAMTADRHADKVGDVLNVLVFENATASNTAQNGSSKGTHVSGQVGAGSHFNETAGLGLDGRFDGTGQTARAGRMVAQISVTVEAVLPNGDLLIAGQQRLNINKERTFIKLRGRVRRDDIRDNSVASSRIADAEIDYDGSGFVSRSTKPGLITRIFNFLGLV
jgi:flagellar L-ring protein precursor FlgH